MTEMVAIKSSTICLIESYSASGIPLGVSDILRLADKNTCLDQVARVLRTFEDEGLVSVYEREYYLSKSPEANRGHTKPVSSGVKIIKVKTMLNIIAMIPCVKGIAITGSAAFEYMPEDGDIDILIITDNNALFFSRMLIFIITSLYGGARRRRSSQVRDKLCVNVILEERQLKVPYPKRSIFSAREMVSMKKYYDAGSYIDKLKSINDRWVSSFLPNYPKAETISKAARHAQSSVPKQKANLFLSMINSFLAFGQLWYMKSKVTNELVTKSQIWLHPDTRAVIV